MRFSSSSTCSPLKLVVSTMRFRSEPLRSYLLVIWLLKNKFSIINSVFSWVELNKKVHIKHESFQSNWVAYSFFLINTLNTPNIFANRVTCSLCKHWLIYSKYLGAKLSKMATSTLVISFSTNLSSVNTNNQLQKFFNYILIQITHQSFCKTWIHSSRLVLPIENWFREIWQTCVALRQ